MPGANVLPGKYPAQRQRIRLLPLPPKHRNADQPGNCATLPVRGEWLESLASDLFLAQVGDVELLEPHLVPGDTNAAELEEIGRAIADLTADRYVRGIIHDNYGAILAGLQAEHARLAELPSLPPRTKRRPTGKTFGQLWNATTDTEARRMLMQKAGFRLNVARTASGITVTHSLDEDLARRAGLAAIGLPVTVPAEAPGSHAMTSTT